MASMRALRERELWPHGSPASVRRAVSSSLTALHRLRLEKRLEGHDGCVNTLSWTPSGEALLSGSDDLRVIIWDVGTGRQRFSFEPGHRNNIFQAKVIPGSSDRTIVSCAADGQVRVSHLGEGGSVTKRKLAQHMGRVHKLALVPDQPCSFFSCGEDAEVRFFDLREDNHAPTSGLKMTVTSLDAHSRTNVVDLNAIAVNPSRPWLFAVGGDDQYARIFDIRSMASSAHRGRASTAAATAAGAGARRASLSAQCEPVAVMCPHHLNNSDSSTAHITCVVFSKHGELLSTYHSEGLYVFEPYCQQRDSRRPAAPLSSDGEDEEEDDLDNDPLLGFRGNKPPEARRGGLGTSAPASAAAATQHSPTWLAGTSGRLGTVLQCFHGHRNLQTIKGCNFFGADDEYVVSGSDCGHVFIWDKTTGRLQQLMHGDTHVVNCLEPHPWQPLVLATSGIANDVKVWAPVAEEPRPPNEALVDRVLRRNANASRAPRPRALSLHPQTLLRMFLERRVASARRRRGDVEGEDGEGDEGNHTQRVRLDQRTVINTLDMLRQLVDNFEDRDEDEEEEVEEDDGAVDASGDDSGHAAVGGGGLGGERGDGGSMRIELAAAEAGASGAARADEQPLAALGEGMQLPDGVSGRRPAYSGGGSSSSGSGSGGDELEHAFEAIGEAFSSVADDEDADGMPVWASGDVGEDDEDEDGGEGVGGLESSAEYEH